MPRLKNARELPSPSPYAITFDDPRPSRKGLEIGVIGFCHLGKDDEVDTVCGAPFLSNWFDLSPTKIELMAPSYPEKLHFFFNSETAFHALKFWRFGDTFATTPAKESWTKYRKMTGKEDATFGGYGSEWKAMRAVLTAKFAADQSFSSALRKTGDAFLVHHVPQVGRDPIWSDNGDGSGQNRLGILLMVVRDSFSGRDTWTEWFESIMDVEAGTTRGKSRASTLQDVILSGTLAIVDALEAREGDAICKRPGCGKPTWNGLPGEYCEGNCAFLEAAGIDDQQLREAGQSEGSPEQLALPAPSAPSGVLALASESQPSRDRDRDLVAMSTFDHSTDVGHTTTLATVDRDMQMMRSRRQGIPVGQMKTRPSTKSVPMVDVNRPGILPTLILTFFWMSSAVAVLAAIIWVYAYEEIRRHEDLATVAAVSHARFLAAELLRPAEAVVRAVAVGFGGGTVGSLADYRGLERLLEPHFRAQPSVHEVELAGPPEEGPGSIRVTSASWLPSGILFRTDRPDCESVDGDLGCSLEDMHVNATSWYRIGFGVGNAWHQRAPSTFWHGPSFSRSSPLEVVCADFCWRATYAFVGRVVGGPHLALGTAAQPQGASTSTTTMPAGSAVGAPVPPVLVRAAMEAQTLQGVVTKAEVISHGEAVVCTQAGDILASRDMADAVFIERSTGVVRPRLLWELDRPWAKMTNPEFVKQAKDRFTFLHGGYRASAWKLGDVGQVDILGLASDLRIVLAVPQEQFYDEMLGPVLPVAAGTAATPVVGLAALTFVVGLARCVLFLRRRQQAAIALTRLGR